MPGYFSGIPDPSNPTGTTNDADGDFARRSGANPDAFAKPSIFDRLFGSKGAGKITTTQLPPLPGGPQQGAAPQQQASPQPAISSGQGLLARLFRDASGPATHNAAGQALVPGTSMTQEQLMAALQQAMPPQQPPGFGIPGMGTTNDVSRMAAGAGRPAPGHPPIPLPPRPMPQGAGAMMNGNPLYGMPFQQPPAPFMRGPQFAPPPQQAAQWPPVGMIAPHGEPQRGGFFRGGPLEMRRGGYPEHLLHGMPTRFAEGGDFVEPDGQGDGRSDHVEARLSPGEFVVDAETVSLLGNGDNTAGARRLEEFRRGIRSQKGKALAKGKFSPDAKRPASYMRGAS